MTNNLVISGAPVNGQFVNILGEPFAFARSSDAGTFYIACTLLYKYAYL